MRRARIEKLTATKSPAERIRGRLRRLQVAAEIAVTLVWHHHLRHGRSTAPLPVLFLIDEKESIFEERNRTAEVASELVLVILRRARLAGGGRIGFVAREASRVAVEEISRLCLI